MHTDRPGIWHRAIAHNMLYIGMLESIIIIISILIGQTDIIILWYRAIAHNACVY